MHKELDLKIEKLCKLSEQLTSCLEAQFAQGMDCIDAEEAGEVFDMIKDAAEAEKYLREACYYKTVTEAMDDKQSMEGFKRMGYRPFLDQEPYIKEYLKNPNMFNEDMMENDMYGYSNGNMRGSNSGNSGSYGYNNYAMTHPRMRYGNSYDNYRVARRNYTATKSQEDKSDMNMHANQHIQESINTFRDIWDNAEPQMRKRMKSDIQKLLDEMAV